MTAHDRWLADHSKTPVRVLCRECGNEWDDELEREYGASWHVGHEDCPKCGSSKLDSEELDELDIAERRLEARGEDF